MAQSNPGEHVASVLGSRARLLVAEDDPELRALLALALREDGYDVVEAADGNELLDVIAEAAAPRPFSECFDLIVTDIRMPGFTAFDILGALRFRLLHTPVILITAFADQLTLRQAARLGVRVVLDKPFDVDDLRHAVLNSLTHPAWTAP
jgi:CheY-like chemotaxis protein